jgi:hypothetical protein
LSRAEKRQRFWRAFHTSTRRAWGGLFPTTRGKNGNNNNQAFLTPGGRG